MLSLCPSEGGMAAYGITVVIPGSSGGGRSVVLGCTWILVMITLVANAKAIAAIVVTMVA